MPVVQVQFGAGYVGPDVSEATRYIARLERLATERLRDRLPRLMRDRRVTVRELARISCVNVNTIYGTLGKGRRADRPTTPNLATVLALAAALDVTVDQLLGPASVEGLAAEAKRPKTSGGRIG